MVVLHMIQRRDHLVRLCLFPGAPIHRRSHTLALRSSLRPPCSHVLLQHGKLKNYFCLSSMWFAGILESDVCCLRTVEVCGSDLPPTAPTRGAPAMSQGGGWLHSAPLTGSGHLSVLLSHISYISYVPLWASPAPLKCILPPQARDCPHFPSSLQGFVTCAWSRTSSNTSCS